MVIVRAVTCILTVAVLSSVACAEDIAGSTAQLIEDNTRFAFELYSRIAQDSGNAVLSPISVSVASAMLYAGARGTTASEIADALSFTVPDTALHSAFKQLVSELGRHSDGRVKLILTNGLWVDRECALVPEYGSLLSEDYGATAQSVDFVGAPVEASRLINDWVSKETQGKIGSVVSPDMFSGPARVVLLNTVYFRADWKDRFDLWATKDEPFYLLDGATVTVPMMHQSGGYRYYEDNLAQVAALPYKGTDLSMIVVLPTSDLGLPALEERLTPDLVSGWIDGLRACRLDLAIPRFEVANRVNLRSKLAGLGMKRVFREEQANLKGVCSDRDVFVGRAEHLAWLEVTERGTEAAAATEYVISEGEEPLVPPKMTELRVDRPFLYFVRDMKRGTILFMGRVIDPTEK